MSNKQKEMTIEVLLADAMLRLATLERILIDKGILTKEELLQISEEIAQKVSKVVLEKAQAAQNLNEETNIEDKSLKN